MTVRLAQRIRDRRVADRLIQFGLEPDAPTAQSQPDWFALPAQTVGATNSNDEETRQ